MVKPGELMPPISVEAQLRDANLRDATMPGVLCKTCKHFHGLKGHCCRFDTPMGMAKVCDEWRCRK